MASVKTYLGGGRNGQLGLGLAAAEYFSISQTAYVWPVHPGQVAPVGTTHHETVSLRDYYKREIRLFREVIDIEKSITK